MARATALRRSAPFIASNPAMCSSNGTPRTRRSSAAHEREREHDGQPTLLLVRVQAPCTLVEAADRLADHPIEAVYERESGPRRGAPGRTQQMHVMLDLVHDSGIVAEGATMPRRHRVGV